MTDKVKFGKNVVVIGGGLVGCETAAHCAEKAEKVTIIEMLDDILVTAEHCLNNDQALRQLLKDRNINIITGAKVTNIGDDQLDYVEKDEQKSVHADTYIIAAGYKANDELFDQLNGKVDIDKLGDAVNPDKIITAVHQGFHMACNI